MATPKKHHVGSDMNVLNLNDTDMQASEGQFAMNKRATNKKSAKPKKAM